MQRVLLIGLFLFGSLFSGNLVASNASFTGIKGGKEKPKTETHREVGSQDPSPSNLESTGTLTPEEVYWVLNNVAQLTELTFQEARTQYNFGLLTIEKLQPNKYLVHYQTQDGLGTIILEEL